jgi:hypothetical protein
MFIWCDNADDNDDVCADDDYVVLRWPKNDGPKQGPLSGPNLGRKE